MPTETIRICDPSGSPLATCSAPMLPPAPGLFSTMTFAPHVSERRWAIIRARTSVAPAGGKGQTTLIVRLLGQVCAPQRRREETGGKAGRDGAANHGGH